MQAAGRGSAAAVGRTEDGTGRGELPFLYDYFNSAFLFLPPFLYFFNFSFAIWKRGL